jgi:glycosyltransferase involved in cell wall biosynthesis
MDARDSKALMKIVLFVAELDVKGGTHKQVLRLSEYLVKQGHSVKIYTPTFDQANTYPEFANLEIVSLYKNSTDSRLERLLRSFTSIALAFKIKKVDVINIHDNRGLLFFFTCFILKRASSYVWQINDLDPAFRLGNSLNVKFRIDHPISRFFNRLMAKLVDRITVNVGKNISRVRDNMGVNPDLLYCGVDFPVAIKNSNVPSINRFRVLSIGVFFTYRNYERLVMSCANIAKKSGINVDLTIVGDTRYAPLYVENVKKIAEINKVNLIIKENLNDQELDHEISSNHVFAFVNIDQSWGLAVFEAAARNKPIILSNSVGAAELLSGMPGFVMVDPESIEDISNALNQFVGDLEMCVRFGEDARKTVCKMTWDEMYSSKVEAIFVESLMINVGKNNESYP